MEQKKNIVLATQPPSPIRLDRSKAVDDGTQRSRHPVPPPDGIDRQGLPETGKRTRNKTFGQRGQRIGRRNEETDPVGRHVQAHRRVLRVVGNLETAGLSVEG